MSLKRFVPEYYYTFRQWNSGNGNSLKGVLSAMVHDGLRWLQDRGVDYGEVVTHVLSAGMQKGCSALGGRTLTARHSFHWRRGQPQG